MWSTMGYVEKGVLYLDVEEALFLVDEVCVALSFIWAMCGYGLSPVGQPMLNWHN